MATKTKKKLSKALKNTFLNELKDKNEKDRLERVKINSELLEFVVYTNKDQKHCKSFTDFLTKEGFPFIEKEINESENEKEWKTVASTTNIGYFPTIKINNNYLVYQRDFQNNNQLAGQIEFFGDPNYKLPYFEDKLIERLKTDNYNLWVRLNNLEQKIQPIVNFLENLQKELAEEEETNK